MNTVINYLILMLIIWSGNVNAISSKSELNIEFEDLNGKKVSLNQFIADKPIYVKFWATWCQPCREQMTHLNQAYTQYKDKIQFVVVNININDNVDSIQKTIDEFNLKMPIFVDSTSQLAQSFNLVATPYHVLVDTKRNIVFTGHNADHKLDTMLSKLAQRDVLDKRPKSTSLKIETPTQDRIDQQFSGMLYFTSAWCDWYLEESRPNLSRNCILAQQQINKLYQRYPDKNWRGYLTRLWTGNKELAEYKKKYAITHPLSIDLDNRLFVKYNIRKLPTLLLLKKGQEQLRITDFSIQQDKQSLADQIKWMQP